MNQRIKKRSLILAAALSCLVVMPGLARATIVEFQTNQGNFQVNLYDNGTPQTVANFLSYVNNLAYTDSFFHRSPPNFVVQGGGFAYDPTIVTDDIPGVAIATNAPVVNEPVFANVRGTIAMAKTSAGPNTATSQWFFNVTDNTVNLDNQNGGFTVFGEVVGNGMDVIDAISALPTFPFMLPYDSIPLDNYTNDDFNNFVTVDDTHLIIINAIVVTDPTVDSAGAAGLTPVPTTAGNTPPPPVVLPSGGGGGGGSFGIVSLLGLLGLYRRRLSTQGK
jgi:cyclophilin family peptidyl-prolyl cis-trans isomerase